MMQNNNVKRMVQLSMLIAIELLVGLVPFLGFIVLPFSPLHITILHIPVIIAAIVLGPKEGGIVGFVFGITSMINATWLQPNPIESPLFSPFFRGGAFEGGWQSLVICFVPRILVGVFAGLVFILIKKFVKLDFVASISAAIVGSFTNTILVLSGIYFLLGGPYAAAYKMTMSALQAAMMGVVGANGVMEAITAGIVVPLVAAPLLILKKRGKL